MSNGFMALSDMISSLDFARTRLLSKIMPLPIKRERSVVGPLAPDRRVSGLDDGR